MHSVHIGEYFALALGFTFSSLAVAARVYTKMRLTSTMGKEDCEFTSLDDTLSLVVFN